MNLPFNVQMTITGMPFLHRTARRWHGDLPKNYLYVYSNSKFQNRKTIAKEHLDNFYKARGYVT